MITNSSETIKTSYDCETCPPYCCAVYERVQVTPRDIRRLAQYFGTTIEMAARRYTKTFQGERILRRKADKLFGQACTFLDPNTRRCTIYDARPGTCRQFPDAERCGYYDLLEFEREQQGDPDVLPLVQITFKSFSRSST